jgi:hypothetical protein
LYKREGGVEKKKKQVFELAWGKNKNIKVQV